MSYLELARQRSRSLEPTGTPENQGTTYELYEFNELNEVGTNCTNLTNSERSREEYRVSTSRIKELLAASPYSIPTKPVCSPIRYQPRSASTRKHSEGEIAEALRILSICGVRLLAPAGTLCLGIWEDLLDQAELRYHVKVLGLNELPILALESTATPIDYKVRSCPDRRRGEPFHDWLRRAEQAASQRQERGTHKTTT